MVLETKTHGDHLVTTTFKNVRIYTLVFYKYVRKSLVSVDISTAKDRLLNVDDEYGGTIFVGNKKTKYPKDLNSTILVRANKLPTSQQYSDFKTYVGFKFVRFDIPDKWPWSGTCGDYVSCYNIDF